MIKEKPLVDSMDLSAWRQVKDRKRIAFMTNEEMKEVNDILAQANTNMANLQSLYEEWEECETAYKQSQPMLKDMPNRRFNIILPTIEGEVSHMVEQNWAITATGEGPEDEQYSEHALIALDWAFRKNELFKKSRVHETRRMKFGTAFLKVEYDHDFASGFGCPMMKNVAMDRILVDSKIKDYSRFQESNYLIEICDYSKEYAVMMYGEDKAEAINYGIDIYRDNLAFNQEWTSEDDMDGFTLLLVSSRINGNLRQRHISACGVLLYDSAKEGDYKTNQKNSNYTYNPLYKYVDNKYPYFVTIKYMQEGRLHGFGDVYLLLPIQKLLNELWDKISIAMRPNLVCYDRGAEMNLQDIDSDSFTPRGFEGNAIGGRQPVYSLPWGQLNAEIFHILQLIYSEAQRITRFNDIMTGQGKSSDTATEAAIQQQEGSSHTTFEKTMYELTLSEVAKYMLGLMMEFMNDGRFFRLFGERADKSEDKHAWVDFSEMTDVPGMVPASAEYKDRFRQLHPNTDIPKYEILEQTEETTNEITGKVKRKRTTIKKHIELDIDISMGSGLPRNKAFLWQMVKELSQLTGVDMDAQPQPMPKPFVTWKEVRKFLKKFMDLPLNMEDDMKEFADKLRQLMDQQLNQKAPLTAGSLNRGQSGQGQGPQLNPTAEGLTQGGNAQMAQQQAVKQGG